jgi:hypothetical protein
MAGELVLKALKHVWVQLDALHLPMALMGGVALAVWKHVRATRDVDLLVDVGAADLDQLIRRLAQEGVRPKRHPPVLTLGPTRILQLLYEPPGTFLELQVDLLLADAEYPREALTRRVPARLSGLDIEIFVLSCEDLILHKLVAGRLIDQSDAAALLRGNRATLDFGYLQNWVARLGLRSEWSRAWDGAFPGETLPGDP